MKNLGKIFMGMAFFSLALVFCVYAEEAKNTQAAPVAAVATPAALSTTPAPAVPAAGAAPQVSVSVVPVAPPPAPVEKTTLDNLQAAFNGESNAHARYLAFAQKADAEGYGRVASLFRATARAEQVHFERHAKLIKELDIRSQ